MIFSIKEKIRNTSIYSKYYITFCATAFLFLMIASALLVVDYNRYSEQHTARLKEKSSVVLHAFEDAISDGFSLLDIYKRRIEKSTKTPEAVLQIARELQTDMYQFTHVSAEGKLVLGSNIGVLPKNGQLDVSDRDYVKLTKAYPYGTHLSHPIISRVFARERLPISTGIVDEKGNLQSVIVALLEMNQLLGKINSMLNDPDYGFRIALKDNSAILAETLKAPESESDYYRTESVKFPYVVTLYQDKKAAQKQLYGALLPYIVALTCFAILLISLLAVRRLFVKPAQTMQSTLIGRTRETSNLVHDMRTLIGVVNGFSQMSLMITENGEHHNPKLVQYTKMMMVASGDLVEMVDEMLDISKSTNGALRLDCKSTDIPDMLSEIYDLNIVKAENRGIDLSVQASEDLPNLFADEKRLKRMVQNLVTNAIKYTREGGHVMIRYSLDVVGRPVLEVRDSGIGMSEEDLNIAMAEYGTVYTDLANSHDSCGLGLPFVKSMAEAHQAQFHIESELRKGTRVLITFGSERTRQKRAALKLVSG